MVEISALLEGALKTLGVKGDYDRLQLDQVCRRLLGEKLSLALVRIDLKGKILKMEFNHPVYLQEMNFRKKDLLARIKNDFSQSGIKDLTFSLARAARR
jgi:hypothetical protein